MPSARSGATFQTDLVTARALSIRQPWAWAIVEGLKSVENRTWPTAYRGLLLIHAGLREDPLGWRALDRMGIKFPDEVETGGIIGAVDLTDCVQGYSSPWAIDGCWNWLLDDSRSLPFRAMRGQLGLFNVEVDGQLSAVLD
jgi:hypothetical protein